MDESYDNLNMRSSIDCGAVKLALVVIVAKVIVCFYVYYHPQVGDAVAHWVEALRYKPEVRGFDSRWCHWNFSVTFRPHSGPRVDSACNRNECQEYFLRVKAAGV
jgi:hypothetical protein